jgi:hypothetical protein
VVDKLFGPRLAVQGLEGDLKKLVAAEAAQVFEAVRSRITAEASLSNEPPGIQGITVLVKAHPGLQSTLMDFLENLPADRCGAWPVSGWQGVITEPAATARLNALIEQWAGSDKKSALKAAATAARRVKIRSA